MGADLTKFTPFFDTIHVGEFSTDDVGSDVQAETANGRDEQSRAPGSVVLPWCRSTERILDSLRPASPQVRIAFRTC
jgi:hypothetical protein